MNGSDDSIFGYFAEQAEKLSMAIEEAQQVVAEEVSRVGNVKVRARATGEVVSVVLDAESMRLSPERLGAIITATANAARQKSAMGAEKLVADYVAVGERAAFHLDMESPEAGAAFRKLQQATRPEPPQQRDVRGGDDDDGPLRPRSWMEPV